MGDSSNDVFNQREKAFEAKYLHDEELTFKINARRNRLFGQWAAKLLGYEGEKADDYVDEIIVADLQKSNNGGAFRKVLDDFESANVTISDHLVYKEFEKCWEEARNTLLQNKEV